MSTELELRGRIEDNSKIIFLISQSKHVSNPLLEPSRNKTVLMMGVLGNLPVLGLPRIWITIGQGPTALAVGAGRVGVVWTFLLSFILSLLFLPLFGRWLNID